MTGRIVAVSERGIDFEIDYEGRFYYDMSDYFTLGPSTRRNGRGELVLNEFHVKPVPPEHAGRRTRPELNPSYIKAHTTWERNRGSDADVHPRGFHFLVEEFGNPGAPPIHAHVSVVHELTDPPLPDAIPPRPGALLVGDAPRARHPMQCRCLLKLGPGDDGTADVVAYTSRYIMPGQLFILPDGHQGTVRGVRPLYMHATGERYASVLYLTNITAREKPAAACIADPPDRVETDSGPVVFHPCTVDLNATYEWAAHDERGNAVGTWTRSDAANGVWTAPDAPGIVHITLSTTVDGHEHLDGAQVWVEPPESDYVPVPIPQPVQPGDPVTRKRYQVDVRYDDMTLALSGGDITFATSAGAPITAPVEHPPVGPFDFYAEGPTGMNGRMEVTLHGVVHVSLFTL